MCFICVSILKFVFKKGHKSHALRVLGILLGGMALIGMLAYFINSSTEKTSKVSFKAAGVKYKEHFTVSGIFSHPDKPIDKKLTSELKVQEILTNFFEALKDENSTNSSSTRELRKQLT